MSLKAGDRVKVNDPGLAALREIMRRYGESPAPNHLGIVEQVREPSETGEVWVEVLFDDGQLAPYPIGDVFPFEGDE